MNPPVHTVPVHESCAAQNAGVTSRCSFVRCRPVYGKSLSFVHTSTNLALSLPYVRHPIYSQRMTRFIQGAPHQRVSPSETSQLQERRTSTPILVSTGIPISPAHILSTVHFIHRSQRVRNAVLNLIPYPSLALQEHPDFFQGSLFCHLGARTRPVRTRARGGGGGGGANHALFS